MPPERKRKDLDAVLLWHVDRFARNATESRLYRTALEVAGYKLLFVADEIPEGIAGELTLAVNEHSAAEYSLKLGRATLRGMLARVKGGRAVGRAPTGYRYTDAGTWEPNPVTFPMVQKAWAMRSDGFTLQEIHRVTGLYAQPDKFTKMFRNPIYIGEWHYHSIVLENFVPPACTPQQFARVQELMDAHATRTGWANGRHPRTIPSRYLISGLLYCGVCGARMVGTLQPPNLYYRCKRKYGKEHCLARHIRQDWIEPEVLKFVEYELLAEDKIPGIYGYMMQEYESTHRGRAQKVELLTERTRGLQNEISRLTDAIAYGDSPPSIVESIVQRQDSLDILHAELATLEAQPGPELTTLEEFTANIDTLRQKVSNAPRSQIKSILHDLISRIDATRDEYTITPKTPIP